LTFCSRGYADAGFRSDIRDSLHRYDHLRRLAEVEAEQAKSREIVTPQTRLAMTGGLGRMRSFSEVKFLREPLVQFMFIGAAIYLAYGLFAELVPEETEMCWS
jgi:hypothetical protein